MTRFSAIGNKTALLAVGALLVGCAGTASRPRASATGRAPCPDTVRVAETRLIAPEDAGKLTLGAAIDQMSRSLLRDPEAARALEIRESRTELSILVEDAEWVLALTKALEGPLTPDEKARLRRLHESYAARAPHTEVAAQVTALLVSVRDESLRRDLKKLANRSWERERRAKTVAITPAPPVVQPQNTPLDTATDAHSPERYCADKRRDAARDFADARSATEPATRDRLLRRSLESLDACIARHPGIPEAEKARQNRERVEQELKR